MRSVVHTVNLLKLILHRRANIAQAVNATPMPLADAAESYQHFNGGASAKFLLDPHGEF
jgi:glutathione-independent formaldehyde dehydrogenase